MFRRVAKGHDLAMILTAQRTGCRGIRRIRAALSVYSLLAVILRIVQRFGGLVKKRGFGVPRDIQEL